MGTRAWWIAVAAVLPAACGSSSTRVAPGSDAHRVAVTTAVGLLHRVVVPPGATPFAGALPAVMRAPFEQERTPDLVDRHEVWIVNEPSARVVAFERAHAPKDLTVAACCGSTTSAGARVDAITFDAPVPYPETGPIENAQVLVSVEAHSATTAWMRVDAQVVWRPRRDPATIVPATDRVITVDRTVIDHATTVATVERRFNALPAAVPVTSNGPCKPPEVDIEFRRSRTDAADVTAVFRCNHREVTARGNHQELEAGSFVDALLRASSP